MRNQSDLRSTDLDGAAGPKEGLNVTTSQDQGEPTEPRDDDPTTGDATEARPDALRAGQSKTLDTPWRTDGETTAPGENVAAVDILAPSDRAGIVGRLGPYVVLENIGQGGMGIVLKALDERLGRIVAIKMLSPALASTALARRRFEREARAAAAVCHEHVVTIHAVDEDAGRPYLVMQFVAGQSLQERINRDGALGVEEVLRIGMQVASGLAAAHTQGLVHRDIKPANLLLENGAGRVKITDFGLARAIDDASITESGVVLGTPHYMSPEQARGEAVDHRTDLFSLGSVLFATCTGQPPFRAESTIAVLRKVSDDHPRSIRELNPDVPEWLAAIVGKLMAKDPRRQVPLGERGGRAARPARRPARADDDAGRDRTDRPDRACEAKLSSRPTSARNAVWLHRDHRRDRGLDWIPFARLAFGSGRPRATRSGTARAARGRRVGPGRFAIASPFSQCLPGRRPACNRKGNGGRRHESRRIHHGGRCSHEPR